MISYHFLNQTTRDNFFTNDTAHGAGQLWSHIPRVPAYQMHQTPFPLVMANSRPVGSNLTTRLGPESTVYEVSVASINIVSVPLLKPFRSRRLSLALGIPASPP